MHTRLSVLHRWLLAVLAALVLAGGLLLSALATGVARPTGALAMRVGPHVVPAVLLLAMVAR
jgi:hypothetical protein